jgi:hypothetical protein
MVYTESDSCYNIAAIVLVLQGKNSNFRMSEGRQHSPIASIIDVFAAVPRRDVSDPGQVGSGGIYGVAG